MVWWWSKTPEPPDEKSNKSLRDGDSRLYWTLDANLDEIRLLRVKAGKENHRLSCKLRRVSLLDDPKPVYETVSYCWGGSNAKEAILLNGVKRDIPSSAAQAIRRIRLLDADRDLWIDAICINQNDDTERGQQVSAMHKVYSQTRRNLIWLGENGMTDPGSSRTLVYS